MRQGPLTDIKVIQVGGIGPTAFTGMMLSDMGADVVRVERSDVSHLQGLTGTPYELDGRGLRSVGLDLREPRDLSRCLRLIDKADIALEGYRPGVAERLGVGPETALERNPALVYGRLTGYGQTGPYANTAGHDPNFLALSGIMHMIGTRERPIMPLTLVANYGGALTHVAGVLAALHHSRSTGEGQVVDTATSEAAAYMNMIVYGMIGAGMWSDERESNFLDGGAPFAGNYECSDGRWITLGASEPKHWRQLVALMGLSDELTQDLHDKTSWPTMRSVLAREFATRSQAGWRAIMDGHDVCFAPILTPQEAFVDPHNQARGTFTNANGAIQPAPVPKFSATPGAIQGPPPTNPGEHTEEVFADWGV